MNIDWTIAIAAIGALATVSAAVATVGSWRAARGSQAAATTLARIERDRQHSELTPVFDIACYRDMGADQATLLLTLTGPDGLDYLDEVAIEIRDDQPNRKPSTAASPTAQEIAATIWGPLRFRPHVGGADSFGRAVPGAPLQQRDTMKRVLEPSLVPYWAEADYWRSDYANHPLRVTIRCIRDGYDPWTLRKDISIEAAPPVASG